MTSNRQGSGHPRLFFLHVPKCAGASVCAALKHFSERQGEPDSYYELEVVPQTRAARERGVDPWVDRDRILDAALRNSSWRLVMGHFRYNAALHGPHRRRWTFGTLLREPREMLVSYYHFARYRWKDDRNLALPLSKWAETWSARNIAESYVQLLRAAPKPYAAVTASDVDEALSNLEHFELLGVFEDLPAFRRRLSDLLGGEVVMPYVNRSPARKDRHQPLGVDLMEKLDALCAPSQRIYDAVRERSRAPVPYRSESKNRSTASAPIGTPRRL